MTEIVYQSDVAVRLINGSGSDATIGAAAKVLEPEAYQEYCLQHDLNGEEKKTVYGLLSYMMEHRHGTPFEHSSLTFYVRAPIFVWREWHRHRVGFSYNEESGRYKTLEPMFYLPPADRPLMKVDNWKAARPKFTVPEEGSDVHAKLCANLKAGYESTYALYEQNLALGVDPGVARACLPVGIYSRCWVTCNPRSLMHFLSLRTFEPAAQFISYPLYEIELAARSCERLFAAGWPLTYRAFCMHKRVAP